ncbi:type II toxin-antitoxin system VapB family antitoxin [Gordonia sp. (in: high G+C Gram-positive bacteria)]|uniref:type II toxin-antitoxin system VapB family antitoxin n=1 Tax=Gordonia sp. (in: high G+C Gram-positive bacteria) TaxID=84139 RepID=UPI003C7745EC
MIFKGVRDGKPYADHGLTSRDWAQLPPQQFRLDQLTPITTVLALDKLLSEDSTFYGDLFAHIVRYQGNLYLEDGIHRAVRSALRNRTIIHARLFDLDEHLARTNAESDVEITAPLPPVVTYPRPRVGGAHRID